MLINCVCGKQIEPDLNVEFPISSEKNYVRRQCECRRSYEIRVVLIPEKELWWKI